MRKIDKEEMRRTYAKKIINVIRVQGFNSLKTQDMAEHMQISKATLYNYFSSKEEIIHEVAQIYISFFEQVDQTILNSELTYIDRFQKAFQQEVLTSIYISNLFLEELKIGFPDLYEGIISAHRKIKSNIRQFYKMGMEEGIFHSLNPYILLMQDEIILRKLLDPTFLIEEGITIKQALFDYYQAKKVQIIKPDALLAINDEPMIEVIEHLARKLSNSYL